ncbi:uncharacterized protein E0L32_007534 [Thyridium curvatum]|uniref:Uncharacterized protein n=1 Tax=Thyridium curvatum TaxID=1093900 RepID=A0A507AWE4_9PEZI|nr:uncharacterized protein E0L32_007534 [Thyridium curvatum]TPX11797.1 hypothetical protein E0L32_007534 [Thyridium curvatum]
MSSSTKLPSESSSGRVFPKGNGLQELILDPKNTVRKYIENSMAQNDHNKYEAQGHQAGPHAQDLSSLVPNYNAPDTRRPSNSGVQSFAPYPSPELQNPALGRTSSPPQPGNAPFQPQPPQPPQQTYPYRPVPETPDKGLVGPAPPPAEPSISAFPAPRLYHRMITEYQTITTIFYMAKSQQTHNDLSPLASRLKYLAREIWNLRYSRAAEFPYSAATTEERVTEWKVQYEYWADVLEDLLDPRYVARAELEEKEHDWAGVAGLATGAAAVPLTRGKKAAKAAALADDDDDEEAPAAAPVVKKKVAKKAAAAADGEATPVKKKVAKKTAPAAE